MNGPHLINDQTLRGHPARARKLAAPTALHLLSDLQVIPLRVLAKRTWNSLIADRLLGHAAELAFYFFFAIFPALFCASSIFGLAARSAHQIYGRLLDYLALVIPKVALGTVLETFNQITATATTGKVTFGLIGALWSASAGISAIQDTLSDVYKIQDTRSFLKARLDAIGLTMILSVVVTLILASLFGESMVARILHQRIQFPLLAGIAAVAAKILGWSVAIALLALSFSLINYWAPDVKSRRWRFLTPGAAFGILGWLLTSLAFRVYLQYFNTFPVTYGSLGAVMILLTWFYLTGLMILLGAVIDSEIEAAATKMRVAGSQTSSAEAQTISGDSQKSQERS
ncbi:MAG: YihY/virulence factor BrkB family protein [Terracidiphilus sp.]